MMQSQGCVKISQEDCAILILYQCTQSQDS